MRELERELIALAAAVELPGERDLLPGVRVRLSERRRRPIPWRAAAFALAVLIAALAVAFAVPQARSAILRFLGLSGVHVIRVQELPPAVKGPAAVGERVSLAEAERLAGFRPLLPDLGRPDAVYVGHGGNIVILLYGSPRTRLRLTELQIGSAFIDKFVRPGQRVERVGVDDELGIWIEGQHVVGDLFGQPRLSGNALLWEQRGLTLRLDGHISKKSALQVARSVR